MNLAGVLEYSSRAYLDVPLELAPDRGRRIVLVGKEGRKLRVSIYDWMPQDNTNLNDMDAEDLWEEVAPTDSLTKFFDRPEEVEAFFQNNNDWDSGAPFDATPFGS